MLQRSSLPFDGQLSDGELSQNVTTIEMNHSMFDRE